jgi:hypothetical protein
MPPSVIPNTPCVCGSKHKRRDLEPRFLRFQFVLSKQGSISRSARVPLGWNDEIGSAA